MSVCVWVWMCVCKSAPGPMRASRHDAHAVFLLLAGWQRRARTAITSATRSRNSCTHPPLTSSVSRPFLCSLSRVYIYLSHPSTQSCLWHSLFPLGRCDPLTSLPRVVLTSQGHIPLTAGKIVASPVGRPTESGSCLFIISFVLLYMPWCPYHKPSNVCSQQNRRKYTNKTSVCFVD